MYSPAVALAWEFWGRHRWGLAGVAALVAAFALVCAVAPFSPTFASVSSIWLVMGLCYVIGVFAYGFEGRLETAESGFPARLLALPVRTRVLVGWPMVQGMAAAVLLWLAWDRLVLRPSGVETPAWWTVMLAAVVVVSQAIVWLPFGLPWLRLVVALGVLTVLARAPLFFALAGVPFTDPDEENRVMIALAGGLIPSAFLAAWTGVARARRGDDSDWLRYVRRAGTTRQVRAPFASPVRAQVWYERCARGRGFVVFVACELAGLLALAVLLEQQVGWHVTDNFVFLTAPLLLAPFWGSYAGMSGERVRSARLTMFAATRPLNNSTLVAAKFRAAGLAALGAWAIVLVVTSGWVLYTGGQDELARLWGGIVSKYGGPKAVTGCALLAAGPVLVTWRMLVVGQWAGLTGREWLVATQTILFGVLGFQVLYELAMWNTDLERRERVRDILPWIVVAAVAVKLVVAGWALCALRRRGELTAGTAGRLLIAWSLLAAGLFGLLAWLVPSGPVPVYGLALGVVLIVPFARPSVAPLALAWNRHR